MEVSSPEGGGSVYGRSSSYQCVGSDNVRSPTNEDNDETLLVRKYLPVQNKEAMEIKMGPLYGDSSIDVTHWDRKAGTLESAIFVVQSTYLSAFLPLYPFCFVSILPHDARLVFSLLVLMPLIKFISDFTDFAADGVSQVAGGLLNASLGNLPELIIAVMSMRKDMNQIAKISMFGSIVSNLLLVAGFVYLVQGLKFRSSEFSRKIGLTYAAIILVAASSFVLAHLLHVNVEQSENLENILSICIAVLLLGLYIMFCFQQLRSDPEDEVSELISPPSELPGVKFSDCVLWLCVLAAATSFLCDVIIDCIEPVAEKWNCTQVFIAGIILPFVGNIPEHYSAVVAASKNKMNLALSIAVGSAIQIATLLFPILVFAGISIGVPMSFYVGQIETYIIVASCFFSAYPLITGTSSYVIGYCFIVFYIFYVVGYYFREESSAIAGES